MSLTANAPSNIVGILAAPWAIMPDRLEQITSIYSSHLRGDPVSIEALQKKASLAAIRQSQGYEVIDGVAVVPINGIIAKKMNLFTEVSGGASTQLIERDFRGAMANPDVHAVILHADTPGGSIDGTAELAKAIFDSRGKKPIYTLADGLMASAGVWIGSAADQVYVTSETTIVGSIGVVTQHVDYSERDKKRGVNVTEIYAGKYKRIAGQNEPLSSEGREYIQSHVDYLYSIFVDTVAKHRNTSTANVLDNMADGKTFVGQQAISAGLVDGFATLDQLISTLGAGRSQSSTEAIHVSQRAASMTPEERVRAEWDNNATLRNEFGQSFEGYAAYERNRFRTRVVRG